MDIPEYLKVNKDAVKKELTDKGNNIAMIWLYMIRSPFPDWMRYDWKEMS